MPLTKYKVCHRVNAKLCDYAGDLELDLTDYAVICRERSSYARTIGAREAAVKLRAIGSLLQRCADLAIAIQEKDLLPQRDQQQTFRAAEVRCHDGNRARREISVATDPSSEQDLIERFLLACQVS